MPTFGTCHGHARARAAKQRMTEALRRQTQVVTTADAKELRVLVVSSRPSDRPVGGYPIGGWHEP